MMASASSVTESRMCSLGACWEQPGYECGTQIVGRPSPSENTSLGSEPPKFGRTAGAFPVACRIDAAVHLIHGLSKSVREAAKLCAALTSTIENPWPCKCAPMASTTFSTLVPTTKRSCSTACARPGMALARFSILPEDIAKLYKL